MPDIPDAAHIVALALAEDLGVDPGVFAAGAPPMPGLLDRDVTSAAAVSDAAVFSGRIVAREACIVAGLGLVAVVCDRLVRASALFTPVNVTPRVLDGSRVGADTTVATVVGPARIVLAAERTALDFLMLLSGIATETAEWVELAGPGLDVCDTRKTVPGLRELSKHAVAMGGGVNHRHGLYDMVLVKDNHRGGEGIAGIVQRARAARTDLEIQVEADTPEQAVEAVTAGADLVLLDNMEDGTLVETVAAVRKAALDRGRPVVVEASGGISRGRLRALREAGVDRVSSSALTLGTRIVDFGLDDS